MFLYIFLRCYIINCSYKEYLSNLTYKKLYEKVRENEDHDIKYKFILICGYLKERERARARERERERMCVCM